jgi:hypothetical protein
MNYYERNDLIHPSPHPSKLDYNLIQNRSYCYYCRCDSVTAASSERNYFLDKDTMNVKGRQRRSHDLFRLFILTRRGGGGYHLHQDAPTAK